MKDLKFRWVFICYAAVLSLVVLNIYPANDDWVYGAPQPESNILEGLMPSQEFWRPIHNILSAFLGKFPRLFPMINHCLCLICHFTLCLLLYALLKKIVRKPLAVYSGTLFFCLSPGIAATVSNPDMFEQLLAALFGAAAALCFFKAVSQGKTLYYLCWLVCAFMAVLSKEHGIAWFLAPVMLYMVYSYSQHDHGFAGLFRENYLHLAAGLAGMFLYFALRFYLTGGVVLGSSSGRYALNFSPLNILKNYALIIGSAVTSIDPLAIFLKPRSLPLAAVTLFVSIMFLVYVFLCLRDIFRNNRKMFIVIAGLFVCAGYISSPLVVMGHVADNTTYEMAFMAALILGIILSLCKWSKRISLVISIMLLCMCLVLGHKLYTVHVYSLEVREFIAEHRNDFRSVPSKVFVYYVHDVPRNGYSVYAAPVGDGLYEGKAFNSVWKWKADFTVKTVSSDADIDFTPASLPEYDTVFSLSRSGNLKVLRN